MLETPSAIVTSVTNKAKSVLLITTAPSLYTLHEQE